MSNINKQALREAAEKANPEQYGYYLIDAFTDLAIPATVLALLDELEAAEKRIADLEEREVKLPDVEKWRSPEAVRAQNAYRALVGQELSAAGIITKVGE